MVNQDKNKVYGSIAIAALDLCSSENYTLCFVICYKEYATVFDYSGNRLSDKIFV